jgi:preprotein translocase subunit SecF
MLRIVQNTNIDFIKPWRLVALIIALLLLPGLTWIAVSGFKTSIEFTGGTVVQYHFAQAPDLAQVRSTVTQAGYPGAEVQTYGSVNDFIVRAQERSDTAGAVGAETAAETITAALRQRFPDNKLTVAKTDAIGPRVGQELKRNAIIAMLISFVVTLVYLAWRFDARLGLASIGANIHDIVATFAFIKYMQIEMSLFVVGGILTVIGYSLADKVVVFDRVRELLKKNVRRPLTETLNVAINETLPRTIMTGSTVLACLIALILLGGEVLRPFAWVLLFGIVIGTFSSIYVASPLLLFIERKWPRHEGETKGMSRALAEERKRERTDKPSVATR